MAKTSIINLNKDEKKRFKAFEKYLSYAFKDRRLLKNALTHKSYANENRLDHHHHNERLEYLGDAVLELVVSDLLMSRYPDVSEGQLSKYRATLVNEKTLADVARAIGLGEHLYLGKGESQGEGRNKNSILSDALEALFGAVYLDRGFKRAFRFIQKIVDDLFDRMHGKDFYKDYKTKLQEVSQLKFKKIPKYRLKNEEGPDHAKVFEVHLFIDQENYGVGQGRSKKDAEQMAAKIALEKIDLDETS